MIVNQRDRLNASFPACAERLDLESAAHALRLSPR